MYALCTAVNVVYRCNCCVPVCSVLPFCIQLSSYHCVLRMLQCLCCVQYSIFCIYCAFLCCTINQCTSHNISPLHPHNTCTTTGSATTVSWLLIMTTVGKTHGVKYSKEATLIKLIHYYITAWNRAEASKIIIKVKKNLNYPAQSSLRKRPNSLDFFGYQESLHPLCNVCMHEKTNSKNSPDSFSSSWSSVYQ